ncbi:hypothetical protein GH714_003786 [Hevea brasiliensis]|uniref:CCT domain-containing protein n=1 Tax=Hevea brasiliensis TaxID=3981 RepID=A0A6A6LCT2_HEVBR|nr:hypothetical protein GH714_003786 [Hevea brasiliensis]
MVFSDCGFSFSEPFSPFFDSSTYMFQELSSNEHTQNPVHNSNSFDNFNPNILSSSPPSHKLENLSLHQATLQPVADGSNLVNGYSNFSAMDALGVKTEECQMDFDSSYNHQLFMPHSYNGVENVATISYSSNSFEEKPEFPFQPRFNTLLGSPTNYQNQPLSSPENNFLAGNLRRVCSTGDIQNIRTAHTAQRFFSSPLANENSFTEEANFKLVRYSAEERKDKISKYRAKRSQRNFTKTIKTLADKRLRIRGRFTRNDESGEIPKVKWDSGKEDGGRIKGGGRGDFADSFRHAQFQYYNY